MTTTTASAISRVLHAAGLRPIPTHTRSREGLRVSASGQRVRVTADLNSDTAARAMAADARQVLADAGYTISGTDADAFYVSR